MNATKTKLTGAPLSKIPTIKRPVPVGLKEQAPITKSKAISSNQQITVPATPKQKVTESIVKVRYEIIVL